MKRWKVIANVINPRNNDLVRMLPSFYVDASNETNARIVASDIVHVPKYLQLQMDIRSV